MKIPKNLLTEKEQERLYLVHHMHHFKAGKGVKHDLHHCPLFAKAGMKGREFKIKHHLSEGKLLHIIDGVFTGVVYDHVNRKFIVKKIKIKNKDCFVLA
ncbi:MAG: hypothetical protein NTW60_01805 [Candidatus Wolfebacteria bacterium]|nr:hypothetical protein [Candidatus Wolfebacteria bacterium]